MVVRREIILDRMIFREINPLATRFQIPVSF